MKTLTPKQKEEIIHIKQECVKFHEDISYRIDDLCNTIDFRKASHLSHISDRFDLFIKELIQF